MAEIKLDDGHSYEKDDKDNVISITTAVEDPNKKKAEEKREENRKNDGYKNRNPYSRATTQELVTGKKSKGVAATDFAIDFVPTILAFAAGKALKKSDSYKGAKLREHADNADYHATGPYRLTHVEGTVEKPGGVMGHIIYKLYGKPAKDAANKQATKVLGKLAKKYKITPDKADEWSQNLARGIDDGIPEGFIKDLLKEMPHFEKYSKKVEQQASDVLSKNVKLKEGTKPGRPKVEVRKTDEDIIAAPAIARAAGKANAAFDVGNTLFKARDDHEERFKQLKANNGGLRPTSPLPTITNILDSVTDGTWRYNKKEVISEVDKIYDYVKENGTEEQLSKVLEVYANTNFNKKDEAVYALKELARLIR